MERKLCVPKSSIIHFWIKTLARLDINSAKILTASNNF